MIRDAKSEIDKIGALGHETEVSDDSSTVIFKPPSNEREAILKGVQRALAQDLQELSMQFRTAQRGYLSDLENQARSRSGGSFSDIGLNVQMSNQSASIKYAGRGFTEQQLAQIDTLELEVTERTEAITNLVRSLQELQQMFVELADLVTEQGTVLDRIDYNVSEAQDATKEASIILHKAKKRQDGSRNKLLFLLVIAGVVLLLIVVGILTSNWVNAPSPSPSPPNPNPSR